jgi:hypothetical protein
MDPATFPPPAATVDEEIARQANAAAAPAPSPDFDSLGRPFDPVKFRREKDTLGRWKNARAGRKGGPAAPPAAGPASAPKDPTPADFSDVDRAAGTAEGKAVLLDDNATADTVIGVIQTALVLIGDEEGVLSEMEKTLLRRPLVRVLEKYNVGADVMPAEVDLCLALAGLLITRLQKPKTATWFAKVKAWALNLWFRGKGASLARDLRHHVGPIPQPGTSHPAP